MQQPLIIGVEGLEKPECLDTFVHVERSLSTDEVRRPAIKRKNSLPELTVDCVTSRDEALRAAQERRRSSKKAGLVLPARPPSVDDNDVTQWQATLTHRYELHGGLPVSYKDFGMEMNSVSSNAINTSISEDATEVEFAPTLLTPRTRIQLSVSWSQGFVPIRQECCDRMYGPQLNLDAPRSLSPSPRASPVTLSPVLHRRVGSPRIPRDSVQPARGSINTLMDRSRSPVDIDAEERDRSRDTTNRSC